jgi:formamidopyrimidine-DNA glycosylase
MPELPEVEITRRGIAPPLLGRRLASVYFRVPALRYPLPHEYVDEFRGQVLRDTLRRGKYLLLDFGSGHLLIHLGMSGSLRIVDELAPVQKHDHIDLVFGEGKSTAILRMRDPRRFGAMTWIAGDRAAALRHPLIATLGIEPLTDEFTGQWLHDRLKGIKAAIKPALMDSHRVVGIGNIYASESLFRASIDPRTPAGRVSRKRIDLLVPAIKQTLNAAIDAGGSSLRDFIHSDGSSGYFQQQYFVYGRTGDACRICATPIREIRQAQRASFYCPRCQRR